MKKLTIFWVALILAGLFPRAEAVMLTVGQDIGSKGETLTIPICTDNLQTLVGASFTLLYSSSLDISIESGFFSHLDTLTKTGTSEQDQDMTNLVIAAAKRGNESGCETGTSLFTLNVSLKAEQPVGVYDIAIIPTVLNRTEAGYDANGETIDLLTGKDIWQDDESAFTVLLDDVGYESHVLSGQAEFKNPVKPMPWIQLLLLN